MYVFISEQDFPIASLNQMKYQHEINMKKNNSSSSDALITHNNHNSSSNSGTYNNEEITFSQTVSQDIQTADQELLVIDTTTAIDKSSSSSSSSTAATATALLGTNKPTVKATVNATEESTVIIVEKPHMGYLLFNIHTLMVFNTILNDTTIMHTKHMVPLITLGKYIVRSFFKLACKYFMISMIL